MDNRRKRKSSEFLENRETGRSGRMVSFWCEKFGFWNSGSQNACCSSEGIGTKKQAPFWEAKIVEPQALFSLGCGKGCADMVNCCLGFSGICSECRLRGGLCNDPEKLEKC